MDKAEEADFESQHIEGYALQAGNKYFKAPLYSQIDGNLWMGGCPREDAPEDFKYIIDLYGREFYRINFDVTRIVCHLFDSGQDQDLSMLPVLARLASEFADRGKTLVHCQAGLNRSSLVVGMALIHHYDICGEDAVNIIRTKRHSVCLCNDTFKTMLLNEVKS